MKKMIKLVILILISLSVYFIYENTKNKTESILVLGDSIALGINSYGIYDYTYADYYKDLLKDKKITLNQKYCKKSLTIEELTEKIRMYPEIKKDLKEATILLLNIGYTDLIYTISLEENIKSNGVIENFKNGKQEFIRESQALKSYNNTIKNY